MAHARTTAVLCAAVLFTTLPTAAAGQQGWLRLDHWSQVAIVRLHALGAVPAAHDPARLHRSAGVAARLLAADGGGHARIGEELTGDRVRMEAAGLVRVREEVVRTGRFTAGREWTGAGSEADGVMPGAAVRAELRIAKNIQTTLEAAGYGDEWRVEQAAADVAMGHVAVWGGRRRAGYAPGTAGGLVLTASPAMTGAGVELQGSRLGGELFAGRVARNGMVSAPWLIGTRVLFAPHGRLDLGGTRAGLFGSMTDARLGVRELLEVLVGGNLAAPYADDQVGSVDARWRPPMPVPIELFGEWGMHDIDPGVLVDVPAFTVGVRAPSIGLTVEHTQISGACCGNPPWYHHFELSDGWTTRGEPIGHPLGGQGREWRVTVDGVRGGSVAQLSGAVRRRGAENLYAPERAGRAEVLRLVGDARLARRTSVAFDVEAERGDEWTQWRAHGGVRVRF